jgi:tripartite-type tricarboxylate transporter receptor subunit TctC
MHKLLQSGLIAAAAGVAVTAIPAAAQDYYAGKTIDLVVGNYPGGGFDIYARAVARHLGRNIPGNPAVVVKNMPGAGSGRAAAFLASVAPKDGTVIAGVFPGGIMGPLLEDRAQDLYDPTKFMYLASADSGTRVCATFQHSKVKTFEDATRQKAILGASAAGGSTRDYVNMHRKTAGAKFELVTGYKGTADLGLAMERGEIDGICGWDWSSVKSQKPDWLRDGKLNLLLQVSLEPDAELTKRGVPEMWKYVKNDDDRKALELVVSQQVFGRPYLAPPGTPAEQVNVLRAAFAATMKDRAFLDDAEKSRIDINPSPGDKIQQLVAKIYAMPKTIVERAKEVIKP